MTLFSRAAALAAVVFSILFSGLSPLSAQSKLEDRPEQQLLNELQAGLSGKLSAIRPVIAELLKRKTGTPESENYIFLLALSYQDEYSETQDEALLDKAVENYERYLSEFPQGNRRDFVRFNLGGAYEDRENFEGAIGQYTELYRRSMNAALRTEARDKLCRLYIRTDRAGEGIPIFQEVFSVSVLDPELRAAAASWLLQGYLANGESEKIVPYLRYLTGNYEAIFDPKFNITLLKEGDKLFEAKDYDRAVLLYTFVKPRSAIIEYYAGLVYDLKQRLRNLSPDSDQYTIVDGQLKRSEANLKGVREIREYDVDMNWRIARVYQETKRQWESLWAFYHLYEDHPEHEQAEDFLFTAFSEAKELSDYAMLEQLAKEYLGKDAYQKFRGPVILGLAGFLFERDRGEELLALANDYLKAPENFEVGAQLLNYVGAYFMRHSQYLQLRDYMGAITRRFGNDRSLLNQTGSYWHGLSLLLLADYPKASETFGRFLQQHSARSIYYEDVSYRYAISLYGEQKFGESEAQFEKFVGEYPESHLRGEAELYLGDLTRDRGAYAVAADHYRKVEAFTDNEMFVAKATFALSEVLESDRKVDEAIAVLSSYVDRYGDRGQLAEAYERVGMIYDRAGQPDERFKLHYRAIEQLGNDLKRYSVDKLIVSYVKDYGRYMRTYEASLKLLNAMLDDDAYRRNFLSDRAYQYQYLQSEEGRDIDPSLSYRLVRDRGFRSKLMETQVESNPASGTSVQPKGLVVSAEMVRSELQTLKEEYLEKQSVLLPYDTQALFGGLLQEALSSGKEVLAMRVRLGLQQLGEESARYEYSEEELLRAPPSVLIAEGKRRQQSDPERAKEIYQLVREKHPFSDSVYDALSGLGEIAIAQAESSGAKSSWEEALVYYNLITERYPRRVTDAGPYLMQGRILSELGQDAKAIEVLGMILRNPLWRGLDHAKAHLEIGLAYRREQQWAEAHGFFERLIVAYGGYAETVSWAYYYDLLTLEQMGETESVQQLLEEYKTRASVLSQTQAYELIKEKYAL
ncbi:tetratricopeptide repeat protein [Coraliomargarita parva]|uniref:tetratricopeptide repeat protein n=1 Tax=Coraliomargarita parva TaxID=3014050 RepID=UPI0022B52A11|nr:tetratricopeptide repeat protein [Coraliomargarita parva]